jgi:uncharacterized DUF497 family protein
MFSWDETKRRANIRKHGIDLVDAEKMFRGFTLTAEDDREAYGRATIFNAGSLGGPGCRNNRYRESGINPHYFDRKGDET